MKEICGWMTWDWDEFMKQGKAEHPEPTEWKGLKAADVLPAA